MKLYDKIRFILVAPAVAGNIGAAARALKTTGFQHLVLVDPQADHLNDEARMFAHGSREILQGAQVYHSLSDALSEVDLAIGTTAKNRLSKQEYYDCTQLKVILEQKLGFINNIAIVFGREESGLTNLELQMCDMASTIPLPINYPSLNLGQAVMLYAYELSKLEQQSIVPTHDENKFSILKERADQLLNQLGISKNPTLYHRILERLAIVGSDDMNLLLSVLEKWQKKT